MSMSGVEFFVEVAADFIGEHYEPSIKSRDWLKALFTFQSHFDCSYTHFRVIETLLEHGHTFKIQLSDISEYTGPIPPKGEWPSFHPDKEWDEKNNPTMGYYESKGKCVYFDIGQVLWASLVKSGILTGKDAIAPQEVPFEHVVSELFSLANEKKEYELMHMLFSANLLYLYVNDSIELSQWRNNPCVVKIREQALAVDLLSMDLEGAGGMLSLNEDNLEDIIDAFDEGEAEDLINWYTGQ